MGRATARERSSATTAASPAPTSPAMPSPRANGVQSAASCDARPQEDDRLVAVPAGRVEEARAPDLDAAARDAPGAQSLGARVG